MDEEVDGIELVREVICSLDGGHNGLNLERTLSIKKNEDGTIRYALIDPDDIEQVFTVTIVPEETKS